LPASTVLTQPKSNRIAIDRFYSSLLIRVQELETERRQLIEVAEASRTEAAKAILQADRADRSTAKTEEKIEDLEWLLQEAQTGRVAAEKAAAEALTDCKAALAELKTESKTVIEEQKEELRELRKAVADAEKRIAEILAQKAEKATRQL